MLTKKAIATLLVVLFGMLLVCPRAEAAKKEIATKIDMAEYTCKALLEEKSEDAGMVLIWLDGYLSGKTGDTVLDMKFLDELATEVGNACRSKPPATKVLDVVHELTE